MVKVRRRARAWDCLALATSFERLCDGRFFVRCGPSYSLLNCHHRVSAPRDVSSGRAFTEDRLTRGLILSGISCWL